MKNVIISVICILISVQAVFAQSVNPAVYKTISNQSYRTNYRSQVNNRNVPYWQVQSDYLTRNRNYSGYSNYQNYTYNHNNLLNQYRYGTVRGYGR